MASLVDTHTTSFAAGNGVADGDIDALVERYAC
jgi:hypothetical protein